MTIVYLLCFLMLAATLAIAAYRLFLGETPGDRLLAVDLIAVGVGAATLVYALSERQPVLVDVVVVLGVIIFFGTVAISHTLARAPKDP